MAVTDQAQDDIRTGSEAPARLPLRRPFGAGAIGAVVASACCIPSALVVALGLSLGTAAALAELLTYRPLFVIAGLGLGALWLWIGLRRGQAACPAGERRSLFERALTPGLLAFVLVYVAINQFLVPFLYNIPWLIR